MLRFGGYWENGLRYEKSDAIFRILGKFPFRYITLPFFLSLSRMFKIRSKMWQKIAIFGSSIVPPLYINRKMFFILKKKTERYLLLNEKIYEHAVFAKISQIYPFVQLSGPIFSIIYRFSQKWLRLKVIDMVSVS